jgi:hypothetical protein
MFPRKLLLKNKLTHTCMSNIDTVASYLMKITELRDQHFAISMKIDDEELVPIALNVSHTIGKLLCRVSVLENTCRLLRSFGTHSSKKKQGKKQWQQNR